MRIQVITVGTKNNPEIESLISAYSARLRSSVNIEWANVKHGSGDTAKSIQAESENILKKIPVHNYVILLDGTGEQLDSPALSKKVFTAPKPVTFIIGGSYGVSQDVLERADFVLSLSRLVFPHKLVRLLLTEQLYRAYCVHTGHPYHHS